jgi:hypothetical protein
MWAEFGFFEGLGDAGGPKAEDYQLKTCCCIKIGRKNQPDNRFFVQARLAVTR